mgnify:CR=1 FL=1
MTLPFENNTTQVVKRLAKKQLKVWKIAKYLDCSCNRSFCCIDVWAGSLYRLYGNIE